MPSAAMSSFPAALGGAGTEEGNGGNGSIIGAPSRGGGGDGGGDVGDGVAAGGRDGKSGGGDSASEALAAADRATIKRLEATVQELQSSTMLIAKEQHELGQLMRELVSSMQRPQQPP